VQAAEALERMQATGRVRANYFNPRTGNATENLINLKYAAKGFIYLGRQVRIDTPYGERIADLQFCNPKTGEVFNIEAKTNNSAYTPAQSAMDAWIKQNLGIDTTVERVDSPLPWK
jgi:hypothetical protein